MRKTSGPAHPRPAARIHRGCLAAAVVSAVLVGESLAQNSGQPIEEVVVTATRVAQPAANVASAITVVGEEALRQTGEPLLANALRKVPGLAVNSAGPGGGLTQIRIRGAEGNQTLVLIDGIEVNDPSGGSEFLFGNLLVENVARVEILRGPQSTLWGSDAIGGVIQIFTKRGGAGKFGGSARVAIGTQDTQTVAGSIGGATKLFGYNLSVANHATDGFSAFNRNRGGQENDGHSNTTVHANLDISPLARIDIPRVDDVKLTVTGRFVTGRSDLDLDNNFDGIPDDTDNESRKIERIGRLGLEWSAFDALWRQKLAISRVEHNRRTEALGVMQSVIEGSKTKLETQTDIHIGKYILTLGAENEREQQKSAQLTPSDFTDESLGFYTQLQGSIADMVYLTGGARREHFQDFGWHNTYKATAAIRIKKTGTKLRATYGTGFKQPAIFERFGFPGFSVANPDLGPERANSWDAGVEQKLFGGKLTVDATYFNSNIKDLIQTVGAAPNAMAVNLGAIDSHGLELAVRVRPWKWIELATHYTFNVATSRADGAQVVRRPKHRAAFDLIVRPLDRLQTTANVTFNGAMSDLDFSTFPAGRQRLPGYMVVNFGARYRIRKYFDVTANLNNAFNEQYEEVLFFGAPERSARIGVRAKF